MDHKQNSIFSVTAVASSCEVFNQQHPDDEWVTEQELNLLRLCYCCKNKCFCIAGTCGIMKMLLHCTLALSNRDDFPSYIKIADLCKISYFVAKKYLILWSMLIVIAIN